MIVTFFRMIINLKYSIFAAASSVYIDVQPTIILSRHTPHLFMDEGIEEAPSLDGVKKKNVHFALEFSIKRNLSIDNYSIVEDSCLRFGDTSITLKRYKIKTSSEEYKYIDPENVSLPTDIREMHGFRMMSTPKSNIEDKCKLKKGCQLVSLFHYGLLLKNTVSIATIKNIIEKFKDLMGITSENTKDYGFKFTLHLQDIDKSYANFNVIQTNMFRIIFNEEDPFIELQEVDENEYYLEK